MTYRTEVKQARQVRRTAIRVAIADFRSAQGRPCRVCKDAIGKWCSIEPRPGWHQSGQAGWARVGDVCRPQDGA